MKCRAWETKHQNGKTYIHVVDESIEAEYVKDIAERVAKSPLADARFPIHRDIAGSYLVAEEGNESIGFSTFVPMDSHILDDISTVKEYLEGLIKEHQLEASAILLIMKRLRMVEDD